MRIATWNVERLNHKNKLEQIKSICNEINADIFVLTETDEHIILKHKNFFQTPKLLDKNFYKPTENRVSIFTNYKLVKIHPTYDKFTSLCVELETECGYLLVYGTIIGVYGNRNKNFKIDLLKQIEDFKNLSEKNLCIVGDFNCSFADNYYFTNFGRNNFLQTFSELEIELLTKNCAECIDHIAISKNFLSDRKFNFAEWNFDRKLSDHKGIFVDF
ncbi:MAG: endonuclease/exonuclease/phosphatase family protein [Selenomonadaceae bacterium]|nr:endonuclease/exonuclease/phosphatase family protein [Selenomonadaceae bacterium]